MRAEWRRAAADPAAEEFRRIKPKKRKGSKAVKKQKTAHGEDAGGARVEDEEEEEDEPAPAEQEQKRALGLIILRGENIISVSVEAPPAEPKRDAPTVRTPRAACVTDRQMAPGPGHAAPTGRGAGLPPMMGRPMPYGPPPGGPPPGFPARPFGPPPGFAGPPPGFGGPPPGFRPSGPPGFMPPPPS